MSMAVAFVGWLTDLARQYLPDMLPVWVWALILVAGAWVGGWLLGKALAWMIRAALLVTACVVAWRLVGGV